MTLPTAWTGFFDDNTSGSRAGPLSGLAAKATGDIRDRVAALADGRRTDAGAGRAGRKERLSTKPSAPVGNSRRSECATSGRLNGVFRAVPSRGPGGVGDEERGSKCPPDQGRVPIPVPRLRGGIRPALLGISARELRDGQPKVPDTVIPFNCRHWRTCLDRLVDDLARSGGAAIDLTMGKVASAKPLWLRPSRPSGAGKRVHLSTTTLAATWRCRGRPLEWHGG